jgi:hypothetical protein
VLCLVRRRRTLRLFRTHLQQHAFTLSLSHLLPISSHFRECCVSSPKNTKTCETYTCPDDYTVKDGPKKVRFSLNCSCFLLYFFSFFWNIILQSSRTLRRGRCTFAPTITPSRIDPTIYVFLRFLSSFYHSFLFYFLFVFVLLRISSQKNKKTCSIRSPLR